MRYDHVASFLVQYTVNSMGRGTVRRRASQRSRQRQQQPGTAVATPATTLLTQSSRRGSDICLEVLPDLTQGNKVQ